MAEISGLLFVDGKKRGMVPMAVSSEGLSTSHEGASFELSLSSCDIRLGGTNDRYLTFAGLSSSGERMIVYIEGRDFGHVLVDRASGDVSERVTQLLAQQSRGHVFRNLSMTSVLILIVAIPVIFYMFRHPIAEKVVTIIPPAWEETAGKATVEVLLQESPKVEDKEVNAAIAVLTKRLMDAVGEQPYNFEFHVARNDQVNAFATPGGQVVIFTGLIEKAKSPEEVAGVLAHEIQHVLGRHSLKNMVGKLGFMAIVSVCFGDVGTLTEIMQGHAAELFGLQFSRDEETNADVQGFALLEKARVDPTGMIVFFEQLTKVEAEMGVAVPAILSSHPATSDRIERLRALKEAKDAGAGPAYEPISLDWAALKKRLNDLK